MSIELMAFKIIKGFFTIQATVKGLAGGGTKLADQFRMKGIAPGTGDRFLAEHLGAAKLLFGVGRGDPKSLQFSFALLAHPVGGPGRRKLLLEVHLPETFFHQL